MNQPPERHVITVPAGDHAKQRYQKPVLNQIGLLRDLTQFSF